LFSFYEHNITKLSIKIKRLYFFQEPLYRDTESVEAVIKRADEALYHAKNTGRNKTVTEFNFGEG